MSQHRGKYSREYKDEAVKLVIEGSRPIAEVARELGIHDGTLGNWVNDYRKQHAGEEPPLTVSERARAAQRTGPAHRAGFDANRHAQGRAARAEHRLGRANRVGVLAATPVGKLHTDRYIPLHPQLKKLIDDWLADRSSWQATDLLLTDHGRAVSPTRVDGAVQKAAAAAGLGHVHPRQLGHTLATQAINRGMSLEAIAAMLGHRSVSMTKVYARIADRTVADEHFAVTEKVEALYTAAQPAVLPGAHEGRHMRRLRAETSRRMLGNGYCTRPAELDCRFETVCESCTFFATTIEFRPTLKAQRDAAAKGQTARTKVFDGLIQQLDENST